MYFKTKNPSVKISPKISFLINDIGKAFFEKHKKPITITDGMREPKDQAVAMYNNFVKEKGTETQRGKYIDKKLFDEIADAYKAEKGKGRSHCIEKMTNVIERQIAQDKFISKHLIESAFDIRTIGLTDKEITFLLDLIRQYKYLSFQDKSKNKNPHIHVQLKSGYAIA